MKTSLFYTVAGLSLLFLGTHPLKAQEGGLPPAANSQPGGQSDGFGLPNGLRPGNSLAGPQQSSQPGTAIPQPGATSPQTGQPQPGAGQQQPSKSSNIPAALQAAVQAVAPETPSSIEIAFQELLTPRTPGEPGASPAGLRQFGYSLFNRPVSTFAPMEDVPVGPDYVLGPGDNLAINIWGAMEGTLVKTVDRNGQILLPNGGPLRVWGLTFSQAERVIRDQLSVYYRGFQTSITMDKLRSIRIYVVGEVHQPGSFTISSLSTLMNGLFAAGGPSGLGSLRRIELKRNHHTVGAIDFYDFLLRGDKSSDFRLEAGDTIFIPPIGPVVAIAGEVKRPAIYELAGPTRVTDIIEMAGGLTPRSYLKRVQVIRAKPNAEREVIDLDLAAFHGNGDSAVNLELKNGDMVRVFSSDPRIYNTVSLAGAVKQPGDYELKPQMRLTELLPSGSVLPEGYISGVEILRFAENLKADVVHADLKKAWSGDASQDILLRPRDQITVRSEFQGIKTVTLRGEVRRPGTYVIRPGEHLSSAIERAGGFTERAFLKGAVFTRRSVQEIERQRLQSFIQQHEERLLAEDGTVLTPVSTEMKQSRLAEGRDQLRVLASRVNLGRVVIELDEPEKLKGSASDLLLEEQDTLFIPQHRSEVLVMGSVRNPTGMLHMEGADLQHYINRAGGFSESAEQKETYLIKADGSALAGFLRLRDVEAGDSIVVPPKMKQQDWSWIKDMATIAGQTAIMFAALVAIF